MRFLRGKFEVAASEESADGEKASHKQVSGTRYQILGKEVFTYYCSVRASFSFYEPDKLNELFPTLVGMRGAQPYFTINRSGNEAKLS